MEDSLGRFRGLLEGTASSSNADESEPNKSSASFGFLPAALTPAREAFSAALSPEDFAANFMLCFKAFQRKLLSEGMRFRMSQISTTRSFTGGFPRHRSYCCSRRFHLCNTPGWAGQKWPMSQQWPLIFSQDFVKPFQNDLNF
jgi:hypothetical protein